MKAQIKGKFLAINEGIFNDKPYMTALVLTKVDDVSKVEKIKIKDHKEEMKTLKFGADVDLTVDVSGGSFGMSVTY